MKKKLAVLVLALVITGLMAGSCFAAPKWYYCNVLGTGQAGVNAAVCLTDNTPIPPSTTTGAFTKKWFTLSNANTAVKQLLATSLTGSAAGLRVYALVDTAIANYSITSMYVISDNY